MRRHAACIPILVLILLAAIGLTPMIAIAADSAQVAHSRAQVRAVYSQLQPGELATLYAQVPAGYAQPGEVSAQAVAQAIDMLNFCRWLAYLPGDVRAHSDYSALAQYGAVLLSYADTLSHNPMQPADMPDEFYKMALSATQSSVLYGSSVATDTLPAEAITTFMRDTGAENLPLLGHRRWLLKSSLRHTGLGIANYAEAGVCAVMPMQDEMGAALTADYVAWPAEGAFPIELFYPEDAWSIILNSAIYDMHASQPSIELTRLDTGETWWFERPGAAPDGSFYAIETSDIADGPCLIFRPAGVNAYEQNQTWRVHVTGLKRLDGRAAEFIYETNMISLAPVNTLNIELSAESLELITGETHALSASVVPRWADDTSVTWSCSDEAIATVDALGTITALAPGKAYVYAESGTVRVCCMLKITD